jgi:hypothetical protein
MRVSIYGEALTGLRDVFSDEVRVQDDRLGSDEGVRIAAQLVVESISGPVILLTAFACGRGVSDAILGCVVGFSAEIVVQDLTDTCWRERRA